MDYTYMDKVRAKQKQEKREKISAVLSGLVVCVLFVAFVCIAGYEPNM